MRAFRIRTATGNGKWRGRRISMRSSLVRWPRLACASCMRPVESSAPIGGPSISGGEKGNGAGGNGSGIENEGVNGGCAQPPFSRVPSYHVLDAALDATHRWLADGVAPPTAPPIELKQLPASSLPPSAEVGRGQTGPRWEIVRDEM